MTESAYLVQSPFTMSGDFRLAANKWLGPNFGYPAPWRTAVFGES